MNKQKNPLCCIMLKPKRETASWFTEQRNRMHQQCMVKISVRKFMLGTEEATTHFIPAVIFRSVSHSSVRHTLELGAPRIRHQNQGEQGLTETCKGALSWCL